MNDPEGIDEDPVGVRILQAAIAELALANAPGLTLERVAGRAGVTVEAVRQRWANSPELLAAALLDFAGRHLQVPDTGSFRDDLMAYAKDWAAMIDTPLGRRLLDALVPSPSEWDSRSSREAFRGHRGPRVAEIVRRAVRRGECRPDVQPGALVDLIGAAVCLPVLFYGRGLTESDCEALVGTILDGITPRR